MKSDPSRKIVPAHNDYGAINRRRHTVLLPYPHGKLVFTNGCFGMVHPGHAVFLNRASEFGDTLLVAINSDDSYERVKGIRPLIPWTDRAILVASLESVDFVVCMYEATPDLLLKKLQPDVLVKSRSSVMPPVGHEIVAAYGGEVITLDCYGNYSTTNLLNR